MEQQVRVQKRNADGTVQVVHIRQSACSGDCHKCSGCGATQQTMVLTAWDPFGVQPGDVVVIRSESGPVLAAAAITYLLPLALFFLGFLVGENLWQLGITFGGLGFVLGIAGAVLYDRLVAKKKETVYTIIGYGSQS